MKKSITKALACALALTGLLSCNGRQSSNNSQIAGGNSSVTGDIAFVYIDSLVNGYDLYNDESTKFMAKQNQYEQELQSKGKSLERRAMELQSNYEKRLVTPTRAQEIQQQLAAEQQKLMELRDRQSMELADDQAQIMNRVGDSIKNYIKEFNQKKGYKMIISTQGSAPLLYADPSMDVTQEILKALNSRYNKKASEKESTQPSDTTAKK
ncbi:MAG: OmpH family outer membrane protein [Bacteroidales bacterium]|nr:OmpH family outer membrane protein [Bacteroidales bacterium]MBR6277543.1 OmpH family outer membrane protein [Bacteroidales bacterium]